MGSPGFFGRHEAVLWFIPNLIGYARLALCLYAYAVAFTSPLTTLLCYYLSFCCDELDGRFARMFHQTSTFGAVLDMVTDRLATTGLLIILAIQHPMLYMPVILLINLDIFSHWFQMYQSLLKQEVSHKNANSRSAIVALYYSNRIFMGYCCVSVEVGYLAAYALYFPAMRACGMLCQHASVLPFAAPAFLSPYLPAAFLDALFSTDGMPYAAILLIAAVPGFTIKQVCNWVQLREAVSSLVEYEVKTMKKA